MAAEHRILRIAGNRRPAWPWRHRDQKAGHARWRSSTRRLLDQEYGDATVRVEPDRHHARHSVLDILDVARRGA